MQPHKYCYLLVLDLFLCHLLSPVVEVSPPQCLWAAGFPHRHPLCSLEKRTLASGSAPCHPHPSSSAWTRSRLHTAVSVTEQQLSCSSWAPGVCHSWSPPPPAGHPRLVQPTTTASPPGLKGATHVVVVEPNSSLPCGKINPHAGD